MDNVMIKKILAFSGTGGGSIAVTLWFVFTFWGPTWADNAKKADSALVKVSAVEQTVINTEKGVQRLNDMFIQFLRTQGIDPDTTQPTVIFIEPTLLMPVGTSICRNDTMFIPTIDSSLWVRDTL